MTSNNNRTEIDYRGSSIETTNTTPSRVARLSRRAALEGMTARDLALELDREPGADAGVASRPRVWGER